jgi:signal transduction histidine kinase
MQLVADSLYRRLQREGSGASEQAIELRDLASTALRKTRELVHGASSLESGPMGLALGLRRLADDIDSYADRTAVRLTADENMAIHSVEVATQLYRIAEEAVSNALRHADAREIKIELTGDAEQIRLSIADDGNGSVDGNSNGMGIRIMRFRAGIIDGMLEISSQPGRGTRVTCVCPAPPTESRAAAPPGDRARQVHADPGLSDGN